MTDNLSLLHHFIQNIPPHPTPLGYPLLVINITFWILLVMGLTMIAFGAVRFFKSRSKKHGQASD